MGEFTETAKNAHEITRNAGEALATASTETTKLIESLRSHADAAANDAVQFLRREAEAHPRASLATAAATVFAVMGLLALIRRSKHAG